jgi:hypothetical protein
MWLGQETGQSSCSDKDLKKSNRRLIETPVVV